MNLSDHLDEPMVNALKSTERKEVLIETLQL